MKLITHEQIMSLNISQKQGYEWIKESFLQKGQLYKEIFKYILKYFYIFIGIYENNVGFLTKMIHYYINVIEM
ncbi:ornithine cyclodeaminase [Clostridioides difficile]|nr:ornithine cyclodeaminase [Clostridioides difficile]